MNESMVKVGVHFVNLSAVGAAHWEGSSLYVHLVGGRFVTFKGEALELRNTTDGELLARHPMVTTDFCNAATSVAWQDSFLISHTGNEGARVTL